MVSRAKSAYERAGAPIVWVRMAFDAAQGAMPNGGGLRSKILDDV